MFELEDGCWIPFSREWLEEGDDYHEAVKGAVGASPTPRRSGHRALTFTLALIPAAAAVHEGRTGYLQSEIFARVASGLGYELGEGPSDSIRFPAGGPYDQRLGYPRIPVMVERLDAAGFEVTHQARLSASHLRWVDRGIYPIYTSEPSVGLRVTDRRGAVVIDERYPSVGYQDFESVPPLVWQTLLFIETRGMLDPGARRRNPAVDWDRLMLSAASLALREMGSERNVPGGSTLATQFEKYRHSVGGVTRTPSDKLSQMLTASLRAYRDGPDSYDERKWIVTEYLNSVPLAGQVGHGEVIGLADALWAWYGVSFDEANATLAAAPTDEAGRAQQARTYRRVLSLLIAQRRPSYYLGTEAGQLALPALTDVYLGLLERAGVVPPWLAREARDVGSESALTRAPTEAPSAPVSNKAAGSLRSHLLGLTGTGTVYDLDRMDLVVESTLDVEWDRATTELLGRLGDRSFLAANGFLQQGLLATGDPEQVLYSVLLMERTERGNAIRIQADNYDGDMSLSDGSRLELGSTAKLRTLVTYLEVVEELYGGLHGLDADTLRSRPRSDPLTRWVADELIARSEATLDEVLRASLQRRYSASPNERFVTGGSELTFSNFDHQYDHRVLTVEEAFRNSVNLPFIRVMRDIVEYELSRLASSRLVEEDADLWRRDYLLRFAEHEGAQFVRRFHAKYRDRSGPEVFEALLGERRLGMAQVAWAVRTVAPEAPLETFGDLVRQYGPDPFPENVHLMELYRRTDPEGLGLSDLGFLARIHPLELWVASYRLQRPSATLADHQEASLSARLEVYGWLLKTSRRQAQDIRIQSMLEVEAFQAIQVRWRRLGYPFENVVPSLGTAIGSSGDRPLALAQLAGLVLNGGVALPTTRVERLRFGEGTPFETRLARRPAEGDRRLSAEVASVMRDVMVDVVESGTARRARGALTDADGSPLVIGGKTGTGDNRHKVFDERGHLVESRIMSRTATLVFFAGDRYFGVVTAYVPGPTAGDYRFTSALPSQVLQLLGQELGRLSAIEVSGD